MILDQPNTMYLNHSNNLYNNNLANKKEDFKGSYQNSNLDYYNFDLNEDNEDNDEEFNVNGIGVGSLGYHNYQNQAFEYDENILNHQTFGLCENFENDFEFDEEDNDEIDDNLDLNRIINSVILKQNDSMEQNASQQLQQFVAQDNQSKSSSVISKISCENIPVVQILVDDLLDQRVSLRQIFKNEILDTFETRCDPTQGTFITKNSKLSKSLQRKLSNFYQLLFNYPLMQMSNDALFSSNIELNEKSLNEWMNLNERNTSAINQILQNSTQNQEYKNKLFRSMRSIIERILLDALTLCDQYSNQLQMQEQINNANINGSNVNPPIVAANTNNKLWSEIRSRGCQFLGPQMQDDVLKLILHALDTVTRMSRKILVLYVVHRLKKQYPKASKTSVGHVVQLLYRAGCFKVKYFKIS